MKIIRTGSRNELEAREQRNEKRNVGWENEFLSIERKGAMIDRLPWDEADVKVKS